MTSKPAGQEQQAAWACPGAVSCCRHLERCHPCPDFGREVSCTRGTRLGQGAALPCSAPTASVLDPPWYRRCPHPGAAVVSSAERCGGFGALGARLCPARTARPRALRPRSSASTELGSEEAGSARRSHKLNQSPCAPWVCPRGRRTRVLDLTAGRGSKRALVASGDCRGHVRAECTSSSPASPHLSQEILCQGPCHPQKREGVRQSSAAIQAGSSARPRCMDP